MTALPFLAVGLGLLLLGGKKGKVQEIPEVTVTPIVPPITIPPNGRHLSPEEKAVLAGFIPQVDLDNAILWWNTPASSFASGDPGKYTEAVTTARGVYFRGPNHAIATTYEFVTLAHELVHVGQFRRGELPTQDPARTELAAYQMGLGVEKYLEQFQASTGQPKWDAG